MLLTLSVSLGPFTFPLSLHLYLLARICHKLRRRKDVTAPSPYIRSGRELKFASKLTLALELVEELTPSLKAIALPVYVMFDSWYGDRKLIRFYRQRRWHVICVLKAN